MLNPVERAVVPSPVIQAESQTFRQVPPQGSDESEDWDIPFDWEAPEELEESEEIAVEQPSSFTVSNLPAPVAPQRTTTILQTAAEKTTTIVERVGVATSATHASVPEDKTEASLRLHPTTRPVFRPDEAPLAFALKLTMQEATEGPSAVADSKPVLAPQPVEGPKAARPVVTLETIAVSASRPDPVTKGSDLLDVSIAIEASIADENREPSNSRQSDDRPDERSEPKPSTRIEPTAKNAAIRHPKTPVAVSASAAIPVVHPTPGHSPSALAAHSSFAQVTPSVAAAAVLDVEPKTEIRATGLAREIAVRISAPDAVPVDLQVKERDGAVHVAVHTADAGLQASLRQDLNTLVDRLEHKGFRAEAVMTEQPLAPTRTQGPPTLDPTSAFRTEATAESSGPSKDHASDTPHDNGSAGHHQESGPRQQRRQHSSQNQQRKWTQTMEDQE
jgi:hypothetical protein